MSKKLFLLCALLILAHWSFGQFALDEFNQQRLHLNKNGMLVLGSWALANLISSPILASQTSGSARSFHQMNGYWNSVNLALAGIGYFNAVKGEAFGLTLAETILEQQSIEKILLFNAGLDLAYITGGFFLKERAKNVTTNSDRLKGFGNSLILQGAFLFAFDLAFYFVHKSHAGFLFENLDSLAVHPNGVGLIWRF